MAFATRLILIFVTVLSAQLGFAASNVQFKYRENVIINAPPAQQQRIMGLLKTAEASIVGRSLLAQIYASSHILTIEHSEYALNSAGKTLLSLSRNLDNGVGVDALLKMNFDLPDTGSHEVYECNGGRTSFTAAMNFIHELRHARDGMTGQFIGHLFEKHAVETENLYRQELSISERRCLRDDEDHAWQIWFP